MYEMKNEFGNGNERVRDINSIVNKLNPYAKVFATKTDNRSEKFDSRKVYDDVPSEVKNPPNDIRDRRGVNVVQRIEYSENRFDKNENRNNGRCDADQN